MLQEGEEVQRLTERMKAVLGPFVLRRLKSEVASQLTPKQQHEEEVTMTPQQACMYRNAVQELRAVVSATATGPFCIYVTMVSYFTTAAFCVTPTDWVVLLVPNECYQHRPCFR